MSRKNVQLLRSRIIPAIQEYCIEKDFAEYYISELIPKDQRRHRINLELDGKTLHIDFFFNGNMTTTIQTGQGNYPEIQEDIENFILSDSSNLSIQFAEENRKFLLPDVPDDKKNAAFVYKRIPENLYCNFVEQIQTDDVFSKIVDYANDDCKEIKKIIGSELSEVTMTFFKNKNKLMLQGKPLLLLSKCATYMSEIADSDSSIEATNGYFSIQIERNEIEDEFKALLPNAHDKLVEKIKSSLLQALQNRRNVGGCYDPTFLVYPALRAIDGHLRYVFHQKGVPLSRNYNQFDPSDVAVTGFERVLQSAHEAKFSNDVNVIRCLNESYAYIHIHRNSLFHWDNPAPIGPDTTRVLQPNEVEPMIMDIFGMIEKYYTLCT